MFFDVFFAHGLGLLLKCYLLFLFQPPGGGAGGSGAFFRQSGGAARRASGSLGVVQAAGYLAPEGAAVSRGLLHLFCGSYDPDDCLKLLRF